MGTFPRKSTDFQGSLPHWGHQFYPRRSRWGSCYFHTEAKVGVHCGKERSLQDLSRKNQEASEKYPIKKATSQCWVGYSLLIYPVQSLCWASKWGYLKWTSLSSHNSQSWEMGTSRPRSSNPRGKIDYLTLTSSKMSIYLGVPRLMLRKERVGMITEAHGDLRDML